MSGAAWPRLYLEVNVELEEKLSQREQRLQEQQRDLFQRLAESEHLDPDLRSMYANQAERLGSGPGPARPKPD